MPPQPGRARFRELLTQLTAEYEELGAENHHLIMELQSEQAQSAMLGKNYEILRLENSQLQESQAEFEPRLHELERSCGQLILENARLKSHCSIGIAVHPSLAVTDAEDTLKSAMPTEAEITLGAAGVPGAQSLKRFIKAPTWRRVHVKSCLQQGAEIGECSHAGATKSAPDGSHEAASPLRAIALSSPRLREGPLALAAGEAFITPEELDIMRRRRIRQPPADPFKNSGCAQRIARSSLCEALTLSVIILNAAWIWIELDVPRKHRNPLNAQLLSSIANHIFCAYYTLELVVFSLAFRRIRDALNDVWFIFNLLLLVPVVLEAWAIPLVELFLGRSSDSRYYAIFMSLRIIRFFHASRFFKLSHAMPELLYVTRSTFVGLRSSVLFAFIFFGLMFIASVTLRELSSGTSTGEEYFPTVSQALFSLCMNTLLLDNIGGMFTAVWRDSWICGIVLLLVLILTYMTMLSMLLGLVCEEMRNVVKTERLKLQEEGAFRQLKKALLPIGDSLSAPDGLKVKEEVSILEFKQLLLTRHAADALRELHVDPVLLLDTAKGLFQRSSDASSATGLSFDKKLPLDEVLRYGLELIFELRAPISITAVQGTALFRVA